MQANVESISSIRKKISFEIPADRVTKEIEKVFEGIKNRVSMPGFRKGKAPNDMIMKAYQSQIDGDVVKNLFNETYFKFIQENNIYPVAFPEIETETLISGAPFKYSATVEVFPDVKVNNYKGLKAKREKFVPNEKVVESRIEQIREQMSQLKPVEDDRGAELKDVVLIDFVGFVDDKKLENGDATDHELELGSNSFIPGFEEQVVGMKVNETKRIKLNFPEKYHSEELSGKPVEFDVTLKVIKVKEKPELNDDFAKEIGEETLADVKKKISDTYERQENDRIKGALRESLTNALVEANNFEVPGALVDRQLETMLENTKNRLAYQRLSLEMMGMNEDSYKKQFRPVAENQIKGSLLLHELAEKESLNIIDEDVDAYIRKVAEEAMQDYDKVKARYQKDQQSIDNLKEFLREEKAVAFLESEAVITEFTPDSES
ncbi:MAG: trigger factor [Desulfuromonadales bacterium]|nr:trigger factor [Desulfuromonadales bacterium]